MRPTTHFPPFSCLGGPVFPSLSFFLLKHRVNSGIGVFLFFPFPFPFFPFFFFSSQIDLEIGSPRALSLFFFPPFFFFLISSRLHPPPPDGEKLTEHRTIFFFFFFSHFPFFPHSASLGLSSFFNRIPDKQAVIALPSFPPPTQFLPFSPFPLSLRCWHSDPFRQDNLGNGRLFFFFLLSPLPGHTLHFFFPPSQR